MSDLFVSYSRADGAFVRRLHGALEARGKDAWADWEDIAPTADWMATINAAIEDANACVFVLSPDSIASEICGLELAHAAGQNKRIVPILWRDVEPHLVPEPAARHQWISFRSEEKFEDSLAELVEALDTDLEWVEAHTHWSRRARDWDQGGREASKLLRGADLRSAEQWLGQRSPERQPEPTPLHSEYVLASRRAASRRQRLGLIAVASALVVAIVLAVVALVQRNEAQEQRRAAEERTRQAQSQALTASAVGLEQTDPALAARLAAGAMEVSPTADAEATLRRSLGELDSDVMFAGHDEPVRAVAVSPDGSRIATASGDKTARLWDSATGEEVAVLEGHRGAVTDVAYAPDGDSLATSSVDGTVRLWDVASGDAQLVLEGHAGAVNSVALTADGSVVATGGSDGTVRLWDAETGDELRVLRGHDGPVNGVALSPDSQLLASAGQDKTARIWSVRTGRELHRLVGHENLLTAVEFDPSGAILGTASADNTARLWNVASGDLIDVFKAHRNSVNDIAFAPDGEHFATASGDNTAIVWSLEEGDGTVLRGHGNVVLGVAFSPDSQVLMTAGADATARAWLWRERDEVVLEAGSAWTLATAGSKVLTGGEDGLTSVWDGETGTLRSTFGGHESRIFGISVAEDGRLLATASTARDVVVFRASDSALVGKFASGGGRFNDVALSPDGELVAVGGAGHPRVYEVESGRLLTVLKDNPIGVLDIEFSPDGELLATGNRDRTAKVLDPRTGEAIAELGGFDAQVRGVDFSPDGTELVAASLDRSAQIFDIASEEPRLLLRGHDEGVWDVAYSPGGELVATSSLDGTARLWDVTTGEPIRVFRTPDAQFLDASFGVDAERLAVAAFADEPRVFTCGAACGPSETLLADAAVRAGTLTDAELREYLPD